MKQYVIFNMKEDTFLHDSVNDFWWASSYCNTLTIFTMNSSYGKMLSGTITENDVRLLNSTSLASRLINLDSICFDYRGYLLMVPVYGINKDELYFNYKGAIKV